MLDAQARRHRRAAAFGRPEAPAPDRFRQRPAEALVARNLDHARDLARLAHVGVDHGGARRVPSAGAAGQGAR